MRVTISVAELDRCKELPSDNSGSAFVQTLAGIDVVEQGVARCELQGHLKDVGRSLWQMNISIGKSDQLNDVFMVQ